MSYKGTNHKITVSSDVWLFLSVIQIPSKCLDPVFDEMVRPNDQRLLIPSSTDHPKIMTLEVVDFTGHASNYRMKGKAPRPLTG